MKKYIFTVYLNTEEEQGEQVVPIMAKNLQSATAKLCQGDFYNEDQITDIIIIKNK